MTCFLILWRGAHVATIYGWDADDAIDTAASRLFAGDDTGLSAVAAEDAL